MDTNIDINRQTHQGTAVHEAALYGKIQAVRLLIDVSVTESAIMCSQRATYTMSKSCHESGCMLAGRVSRPGCC